MPSFYCSFICRSSPLKTLILWGILNVAWYPFLFFFSSAFWLFYYITLLLHCFSFAHRFTVNMMFCVCGYVSKVTCHQVRRYGGQNVWSSICFMKIKLFQSNIQWNFWGFNHLRESFEILTPSDSEATNFRIVSDTMNKIWRTHRWFGLFFTPFLLLSSSFLRLKNSLKNFLCACVMWAS